MRTDLHRDERGVSSVEFCLTMPVLFIIILGTYHAGKYMLAHERFAIAARRAAWSASMHENVQGQQVCSERVLDQTFQHLQDPGFGIGNWQITCSDDERGFGTQFTQQMANANNAASGQASDLVDTINQATRPLFSEAVFEFDYDTGGMFAVVTGIQRKHTTSANRSWELGLYTTRLSPFPQPGNLPIGYDQVLKDELGNTEDYFDILFPNAN